MYILYQLLDSHVRADDSPAYNKSIQNIIIFVSNADHDFT